MGKAFKVRSFIFILFVISFIGCSTNITSPLNNEFEVKGLPSPMPTASPQNYEAKFVRNEGWNIPLPEKKKQTRVIKRDVMSENGKSVKRTLTIYVPVGEFFFQREASSNSFRQLASELLELKGVYEIKVNSKIYSYTIIARNAEHNEQTNKSIIHEHDFIYRCFDLDGDGEFETLVTDDSEILVPNWVTQ